MYRALNQDQRLIVPILFCLIFVFYYFKYRHSNIPEILLKSNLVLSLASIVMFVYELLKKYNYEILVDGIIYPFRFIDIWVFMYAVGAIFLIYGCLLHPKYKRKKRPLYASIVFLSVIVIWYISLRIIFTQPI